MIDAHPSEVGREGTPGQQAGAPGERKVRELWVDMGRPTFQTVAICLHPRDVHLGNLWFSTEYF